MKSVIEIFKGGRWIPAAELVSYAAPWRATFEYLPEYVFGENAEPVSLTRPVSMERAGLDDEGRAPLCPSFLFDLVPQGRGRQYLLQALNLSDGPAADVRLAQMGAHNPIGNLRLDTAVDYYESRMNSVDRASQVGFKLADMLRRSDSFFEHIQAHAMLSAGTTGVQGAAPKFLLARDHDACWFADAALPDDRAESHWIVKLPRGKLASDEAVLRNEAAYLEVATAVGLNAIKGAQLHANLLFLPRFDRMATEAGVARLGQESLASLAGLMGFGTPASQFDLADSILRYSSAPVEDLIEFMQRDVLNLALRNTDNHARNTAVQRRPDGTVRLAPLYDFAPMYLDSEMILRSCKWARDNAGELRDWDDIISELPLESEEKATVLASMKAFAEPVGSLEHTMRSCGVDQGVIEACKPTIETQANRLEEIPSARQAKKALRP